MLFAGGCSWLLFAGGCSLQMGALWGGCLSGINYSLVCQNLQEEVLHYKET